VGPEQLPSDEVRAVLVAALVLCELLQHGCDARVIKGVDRGRVGVHHTDPVCKLVLLAAQYKHVIYRD